MKNKIFLILSLFLIILFNLSAKEIKKDSLEKFIYSNVADSISNNIIIISININACYTCNSVKINLILESLKRDIKHSKTMLIVESEIPKDAFSMKTRYKSDYFVEDTSLIFSNNNLTFPNILVLDRNKHSYIFNFYKILTHTNSLDLDKLINSREYRPNDEIKVDEKENYFFSEPAKPFLAGNQLIFLAKRRNQILSFNIKEQNICSYFTPGEKNYLEISNIKKDKVDILNKNNFFDINFIFQLISIDFDYSNHNLYVLCDKLSDVQIENNSILIYKKKGILSIDKSHKMEYNQFKRKNFVEYTDINCNVHSKFITIANNELKSSDSDASVLKIINENEFDTLVYYRDYLIKEKNTELFYQPKLLRTGKNFKFYVLSKKINNNYRIFTGDSTIHNSFLLSGVFDYYGDFEVNDMIIINNTIFIVALLGNSRFLFQSYNTDGILLKEKIFKTPNHILSSLFVKNLNKIILLNKWKYKRWTIDSFNSF